MWFCYAKWPLFHPEQFTKSFSQTCCFAIQWEWAEELVRAIGILGQRWMRMWSQGFQALISFLVCFPKAKDKGEKVWHINTSRISEDKNRFWLYFSKNWGHYGLMTGWKPITQFFFLFFYFFFFQMNRQKLIFDTLYTLSYLTAAFRFWSLWPQGQGLAPTSGPLYPGSKNLTDYARKEPNLLNLVM